MLHASVNSPSRWEEFHKGDCIHKFESIVSYIYFLLLFVLPPLPPFFFSAYQNLILKSVGTFLAVQQLKDFPLPLQVARVLSLIRELRSLLPHVMAPAKIFFPGIIALLNRNRTLRFFFSWSASHIYMRKLLCRKEKGTVLGLWSQKNLDQVQILGNTDMLYNIAYNTTRPPEGRLYGHESWPYIFLSHLPAL